MNSMPGLSLLPTGDPLTPFPPTTVESALPSPPQSSDEPTPHPDASGKAPKRLGSRYTAGLIDGEGCFMLLRTRSPHGHVYFTPVVAVTNTHRHILESLAHTYGGHVGSNGRRRKFEKKQWKWRLTGFQVEEFILEVGRHLVIKRAVARTMLRCIRYKRTSDVQYDRMMAYHRSVRRQNARGEED